MTDRELIKFAREFRRGILGRSPSRMMCFAICAPLYTLLNMHGVKVELVAGMFKNKRVESNHFWLQLPDGRVLDPTADQFNDILDDKLPAVYLGPRTKLHGAQ